jgi:predicted secreted protein
LPGWTPGRTELLQGILEMDTFTGISWQLATPRGRKLARETLGEDKAQQLAQLYKLALVSHSNFISKATINLSLQVRAAWRRLHGLESRFVQETVRPGRRQPDK